MLKILRNSEKLKILKWARPGPFGRKNLGFGVENHLSKKIFSKKIFLANNLCKKKLALFWGQKRPWSQDFGRGDVKVLL